MGDGTSVPFLIVNKSTVVPNHSAFTEQINKRVIIKFLDLEAMVRLIIQGENS
jgi:hypothetical protein